MFFEDYLYEVADFMYNYHFFFIRILYNTRSVYKGEAI